jgi:hypothetical protein
MKFATYALLFAMTFSIVNCTIYQSPDRKEFETESPRFRTQNLTKIECNDRSLQSSADSKKLVDVMTISETNETEFLWELKINDHSVFESENLKGAYCVYESN